MKNLCILIPSMKTGGAERAASRLSFVLSDKYNVSIVVFDGSGYSYKTNGEPYSLNLPSISDNILKKLYQSLLRIIKFNKFKKENKIDITYSFGSTANIVNVLSFYKDKKIISFRGNRGIVENDTIINRLIYSPLIKLQSYLSDSIIVLTKDMENKFNKLYNSKRKYNVQTIHNGYDTELIKKESLRESNEIEVIFNDESKYLITAGSYRNEKGYWHLIKSFYILQKSNDVKLIILGTGSDIEKSKITRLIEEYGISNKVYLLGYTSNIYQYFNKSDLYVLSSISEGFPNALVEALACGIPVVANDCKTGPEEILIEGDKQFINGIVETKFGILTERFDVNENWDPKVITTEHMIFSSACEIVLNNRKNLDYYKNSINRAKNFNYDKWKQKHYNLIESVFCEKEED